MSNLSPSEKEIKLIILRQMENIREHRFEMTKHFPNKESVRTLIIGEGVNWDGTFLGFCIINNLLPQAIRSISIIDMVKSGEVTFFDDLAFEGYEDLVIEPIIGDATRLPYDDDQFDLSISPLMIDDCYNPDQLISEMIRCTKSSGTIMVSGHGLDSSTSLKGVPGILGADHAYQVTPEQINQILISMNIDEIKSWTNEHCWLKIFKSEA